MKKSPILSIVFVCCLYNPLSAQTMQAHLAYSQSTHSNVLSGSINSNTLPQKAYEVSAPQGRVSYGAGITNRFGYADLKPFYAQVEATGFYQKATFEVRDSATKAVFSTYTKERYRIDAPIQLGVKVWWLRAQAGVVPSLAIPEAGSTPNFDRWWDAAFSTSNLGYTYGIGLDILNRVSLDVRYQNDFTQRVEVTRVDVFDANSRHYYKNGIFMVKVGVRISKEKE